MELSVNVTNDTSETERLVLRGMKNFVFLPLLADISNDKDPSGVLFIVVTPVA
jgi:hypothetical protein